MNGRKIDIAILGGGLSGSLLALALHRLHPGKRIALVEAAQTFGGNHVWSWFRRDVSRLDEWLLAPMVARRWHGYDVHFPEHSRRMGAPYSSMTGETLDACLRRTLPPESLWTGAAVTDAGPGHFALADGRRVDAGGVIDARGIGGMPHMAGGWQKFVGQMLRLEAPHGLQRPIVMDARVTQHDGYRFVYCLPFSETEVFVEDTYYADGPALDLPLLRQRIADYAQARGWRTAEVTREETGVLPVIAAGDFDAFWQAGDEGLARAGTRAALVHPLTGYSLGDAVRFAVHIARLPDLSGAALRQASHAYARRHWQAGGYYRMLTRMLFGAASPDARYKVLQRFYGLPEGLVDRFYAARSTTRDKLRLLAGKPPVPILAACASLLGKGRPLSPLEIV